MQRPAVWTPERLLLLVIVIVAVIYWRDFSYDFLLDDVPLVLMNPALTSWHNLPAIFHTDISHFPYVAATGGALHYRPVYVSWLLFNALLFGRVLPWWHLTSLLLHLAVTLLAFRLGVKVLHDKWLAAAAAAIFALHPIHTESVAYVTASTDLLVALFCLAALLFYIRFREEGGRVRDLVISLICAAAGVLSKESAGMFPWLLVAYEALKPDGGMSIPPVSNEPRGWRKYRWTLPYFAVGAAYVVVRTALFGLNAGPGPGGSRMAALADIPLAMLIYAKNLFVPVRLSFFYPTAWSTDWSWTKAAAVVLLCTVVALIWIRHKQQRPVRLLMAWTAILFVPPALALTTFIRDEWVHDRHMYFASIPLCLLVVTLLAEVLRQRRALAAVTATIALVFALDTWSQVPRFRDEVSIYSGALRVAPENAALHRYYASALWKYGRHDEALHEYRTAIQLEPNAAAPRVEYADALEEIGRNADALPEYEKAISLVPAKSGTQAQLLYELACVEIDGSRFDSASAHLREAIAIAPRALNYHSALAQVLREQGNTAQADEELRLEAINRKQFLARRKAAQ